MTNWSRIGAVLDDIAADAKNDATNFDGKAFNGRTVAEYLGNQGAAIAALADIVKELVKSAGLVPGEQEQP